MAQHRTKSAKGTCDSKDGAASNCCSAYLEVSGPVALLSWLRFFHFRRLQPPELQLSDNMYETGTYAVLMCRRIVGGLLQMLQILPMISTGHVSIPLAERKTNR